MKRIFFSVIAVSLVSSFALATVAIDLSKADTMTCRTRGVPFFALTNLQSSKPKFKSSSSNGVSIKVLEVSKNLIKYENVYNQIVTQIEITKYVKNEEGSIALIGIKENSMGNSEMVRCSIIN